MKPCPPDRVQCDVIGCRRTFKRKPEDSPHIRVLCSKCVSLTPPLWRRRMRRFRRLAKRTTDIALADRLWELHSRMWERIRERAIQVKVGITA